MVKTVVVLPVLLLLFLAVYDVGRLMFYRVQVRSAATAAALAAVGTQKHYPIPIPTKWIHTGTIPIPVDGIIINTLHLPNVDATLTSLKSGQVRGESAQVVSQTNPNIQVSSRVLPSPWVPTPVKYVEVTAQVDAPPGVFAPFRSRQPLTHKACAIAWVRPDYWYHDWWDKRTLEVVESFLEPDGSSASNSRKSGEQKSGSGSTSSSKASRAGGRTGGKSTGKSGEKSASGDVDEPLRYYRQVHCGITGIPELVEVVAEAHFEITGSRPSTEGLKSILQKQELQQDGEAVQQWRSGKRTPEPAKTRSELEKCIDAQGDCVDPPKQVQCPDSSVMVDLPEPVVYTKETPPDQRPTWTVEDIIREKCPQPDPPDDPSP